MMTRLKFVLCWHMHQPWYREGLDGDYFLPWVYLHAMKDYSDMAWHLENNQNMRVVVNFSPILLEQLDDYTNQLDSLLTSGTKTSEPLLNYLSGTKSIDQDINARLQIVKACRQANYATMIEPYPEFANLVRVADAILDKSSPAELGYLSEDFFLDLLMRYHLSWCGAELKTDPRIQALLNHPGYYSHQQRFDLLKVIHECLEKIIPRYRLLAEQSQIELAVSPYSHPIIPLLNTFDNIKCCQPDAPRPQSGDYPAGDIRAEWQIAKAVEVFTKYFGSKPKGIWSSEGSVSDDSIKLFENYGFTWTASGQGVWRNSREKNECDKSKVEDKRLLFSSYQLKDHTPRIFFRDDGMSDLIGFEYSKRDPLEAVREFCHNLRNIADFMADDVADAVVSIVLDGENAWEYFADNAKVFLDHLYKRLAAEDPIELKTFAECASEVPAYKMQSLCAGSWVYGNFAAWIGQKEKNHAWGLLIAAKQAYDEFVKSAPEPPKLAQAKRQLAICESSDWFWWFGDYNPGNSIKDFDMLYRKQLQALYQIIQKTPPAILQEPINKIYLKDDFVENAGTMRRGAN